MKDLFFNAISILCPEMDLKDCKEKYIKDPYFHLQVGRVMDYIEKKNHPEIQIEKNEKENLQLCGNANHCLIDETIILSEKEDFSTCSGVKLQEFMTKLKDLMFEYKVIKLDIALVPKEI